MRLAGLGLHLRTRRSSACYCQASDLLTFTARRWLINMIHDAAAQSALVPWAPEIADIHKYWALPVEAARLLLCSGHRPHLLGADRPY